jgi:acetyltransferase-like isoleucine patch superfamily enzyme
MTINARVKEVSESALLENVEIEADKVLIGNDVSLKNVDVKADSFSVGEKTSINDSILRSNGAIEIGRAVQIKEESVLKAFRGIKVGDRTIIDRGVIVGGLQSEKSFLEVGSRCVVLHHTYINTTREVVIGNNTGIGGYCMIFTHGVWQNAFKGYPFQFGRVEIKDDAWLPWHVFVMPSVSIGKGATIAGGSVVTGDIPDYCLAGGVPAKIIRKDNYPKQLNLDEKNNLAKEILQDFESYFSNFVGNDSIKLKELAEGVLLFTSNIGNVVYGTEVKMETVSSPELASLCSFDIVAFTISQEIKDKKCWIEIETETKSANLNQLSAELAQFLRRYGVRVTGDY